MTRVWMRTLKVQPMPHPHSAGYVWGRSLRHSSSHLCAGRFLTSSVCTGQYSWLEERVKSLLPRLPPTTAFETWLSSPSACRNSTVWCYTNITI